jgi:hypothetical protein
MLHKLDSLQGVFKEKIDLLLCSASFEARCRVLADHIDSALIGSVAVARNQNHAGYHKDHPAHLMGKFEGKYQDVPLDTDNPMLGADALWKLLSGHFQGAGKNILIDISTFTHEALMIILRTAHSLARAEDRVTFGYVPASEYSVGDPDGEKWLSKGIREIRSVLGYPGELLPSRKIHLIVLVGFETERARALIEAYEPSRISLGYSIASKSTSAKNFAANEFFHNKMRTLFPDSKTFTFAANDFAETALALRDVVASQPGYNVVIAPMNTKLSTVGSSLAAIADETIQLCYAQAELYNFENYSQASDSCHVFSIPGLGSER